MAGIKDRYSELALLLVLAALVSLVRVYYGGDRGVMVVWKGAPAYHDTVVNLSQVLRLPRDKLAREHPAVLWQLTAMDLIDDDVEIENVRQRRARHPYLRPPAKAQESEPALPAPEETP